MESTQTMATTHDPAAFDALLSDRWSCRSYLETAVPRPQIEQLLGAAQQAPSWCNSQPWQVVVTEGAATERFRSALSAHARAGTPSPDLPLPPRYAGVYQERRRDAGARLYEAMGIERSDREASARESMRNFDLFGAPHVAIVTVDAGLGPYAVLDTGLYLAHFLLAARAMGLAAIAQGALALHSSFIREYFAIPDDRLVVAGVSFGWPDTAHPVNAYRTPRADLSEVVRWASD